MEDYKIRLEKAVEKLQECNDIIDTNKKHITDFITQLCADGLSLRRQHKYLYTLKPITKGIKKDFSLFNKKDITQFLKKINTSDYKDNTKRDFKIIIKIFFKWFP